MATSNSGISGMPSTGGAANRADSFANATCAAYKGTIDGSASRGCGERFGKQAGPVED